MTALLVASTAIFAAATVTYPRIGEEGTGPWTWWEYVRESSFIDTLTIELGGPGGWLSIVPFVLALSVVLVVGVRAAVGGCGVPFAGRARGRSVGRLGSRRSRRAVPERSGRRVGRRHPGSVRRREPRYPAPVRVLVTRVPLRIGTGRTVTSYRAVRVAHVGRDH